MKINYISRIIRKDELQKMLKALRDSKVFTIEKRNRGYSVIHAKSGKMVLEAMPGRKAYLVRMADDLFACSNKGETTS